MRSFSGIRELEALAEETIRSRLAQDESIDLVLGEGSGSRWTSSRYSAAVVLTDRRFVAVWCSSVSFPFPKWRLHRVDEHERARLRLEMISLDTWPGNRVDLRWGPEHADCLKVYVERRDFGVARRLQQLLAET